MNAAPIFRRLALFSSCLITFGVATSFAAEPSVPLTFERVPPTPPERAEATFRCLHGFSMQLLAAEPLVTDPVALEYDERGRAWVVEMCDYPYTDKSTDRPNVERTTDAPLGRVRILEDTDGDGRFDRSMLFAEELSWPTGIALWQGGCYVTATPDVWYLKDADGDGRAEIRRRVFTGFRKLNIQSVINNLRWGLDHKLYAAGASNGGEIKKPDDAEFKPVALGRADFAFDPRRDADDDGETFEVLAGGARFGQTFDDFGNRFICNIRNPVQHVVFDNRYLARNPYLAVTNAVHDAADAGDTLPVYRASPPEPWRTARALRYRSEFGGTALPRSELAGEGYFTSACGITIYRGAAYPRVFYGNAFLGEVAGNLIHRQVLTPDGVTFKSRRGDEGAEFVASTDNWFRPVNFTNAPDGTLHVCDMYRETIEHPWSIPDDMKAVLDLESGRDRGRIYRLTPPGFQPPATKPNLADATPAELVASLENPNSWWRDTAHRLIFERQDAASIEPLRKMLRESKSEPARLHALWSLEGLKAIALADLAHALQDESSNVRRHAIRLSETRTKEVYQRVPELGVFLGPRNPFYSDPNCAFQLALSAGEFDVHATRLLFNVLLYAKPDPWITTAALTGCSDRAATVLVAQPFLIGEFPRNDPGFSLLRPDVVRSLAMIVGARALDDEIRRVLQTVTTAETRFQRNTPIVIAGLAEGLKRSAKRLSQFADDDKTRSALTSLFNKAAADVLSPEQTVEDRVGAARLLAQGTYADAQPTFVRLLDARQPSALQLEAVLALSGFREADAPSLLLKNYRSFSPAIRGEIVEALASRIDYVPALVDAVEQRIIGVGEIPQARRLLLVRSKDPAVAARAVKLFDQGTTARAPVIEKYRPALKLAGDVERGLTIFRRECKACHKLRGEGFEVGPNLATILHRTPDELLTHVLDPSREVSPNYLEYVVSLDDGRVLTGLVAEETAAAITLRRAENAQETILRRNIDEMAASGKSLMPEGLEQKVTVQDMADLLTFLLHKK